VRGGAGVQHRSPHRDLSKLIDSVDSIRPARASSTPGSSNVTAPPTAVASLGLLRTSRRPQAAHPAPRPGLSRTGVGRRRSQRAHRRRRTANDPRRRPRPYPYHGCSGS